ncbi:hypothetical protein ACS0TY_013167 [Phlomoides rotata]
MAFIVKTRVLNPDDKVEVSMEEFKKWLSKFDKNRDGRISADELREAIRANRGRFCKWKANRVLKSIDTNSNGFVDDGEISMLVILAQKQFGLKIVAF